MRTMKPMNRILPLACAVWMLALFLATPRAAQTTAEARNGEAAKPKGHPDLSLFTHSGAIQDECGACHMPMSVRIQRAAGGEGEVFSQLPIANGDDSELHRLAGDSIS